MFLTYLSIVGNYLPDLLQSMRESPIENPVLAVILGVIVLFAAPFLGGFQGIIGIIIVGIGLYEAWKINRKTPLTITGPFQIAATAPPALTPEA